MRIGLVNDLHWMRSPPASPTAWHNPGEFEGVLERLRLALAHFAAQEVDLLIAAGDFAHHGDVDSLAHVLSELAGASAPALAVSGNHDVVEDSHLLERALEQAAVAGVALATPEGFTHGDLRLAGVHVDASEGWFGVRLREPPEIDAWGGEPVLLVSHYPVLSPATEVTASGFPYPGDLVDRAQIAGLLGARSAPTVVLSGHIHARASLAEGSVLQIANAALVEPPYECSSIEIETGSDGVLTVTRESLRVGPSASRREPVFCASQQSWGFDGAGWSMLERVPA